jgi:signal transduction histidine kinase
VSDVRHPRSANRHPVGDAGGRLLAGTRRQIAAVTLILVAALLVAVGVATALAAVGMLDASVDRALETAGRAAVQALAGEAPSGDGGEEGAASGELDHVPAAADTYILVLDTGGRVVSNPSNVATTRGPDDDRAVEAARASGRDLRTVTSNGVRVRLLTLPVPIAGHGGGEEPGAPAGSAAAPAGFVQAGFVLSLHDDQARSLVLTILVVSLFALAGAAVVTLVVTRRALVPIGEAFAHERRFVAGASHELRTPVALIRSSAEVLEREGLVVPDGMTLVSDIQAEADRLGRLVSDLLSLATAGAGGMRLDFAPVDLDALARTVARRAVPYAAAHGARLIVEEPATPVAGHPGGASAPAPDSSLTHSMPRPAPVGPIVLGDADRLTQLLIVLVENAVLHSPPGGEVRIAASATHPAEMAEIVVSDEGPGIPEADREGIFEPFSRLAGRGGRAGHEGSGLGLAVAREIADLHGGAIRVDDSPGGGSRFTVAVPLIRSGSPYPPVPRRA